MPARAAAEYLPTYTLSFLDPSLLCFTAVPLSELCLELGASSCMCIGGTHPHPNSSINITQLSFGRLFKVNAY